MAKYLISRNCRILHFLFAVYSCVLSDSLGPFEAIISSSDRLIRFLTGRESIDHKSLMYVCSSSIICKSLMIQL